MQPIDNLEDVIDSRDVIERIEELATAVSDGIADDEDSAELATLKALSEEAAQYVEDWEYGVALIRDKQSKGWPFSYIDWDAAAAALKEDCYTAVDFDGVTYWVR